MFNKNLFKSGFSVVNERDIKVIDSNALLEKKIKEANAALHAHNSDEIPLDMVDGMDAFTVANLLGEENAEEADGEQLSEDGAFEEGILSGGETFLEETNKEENTENKFRSNIIKAVPAYNGPTAEEVTQAVEEKLRQAEKEAESIIAEAEDKAESIRLAAHEQGKKAGYDEGYAKGLAQMVEKEQALKRKEALLEEDFQKKIDELEPKFVDTLTAIYEHIFHVDLSENREIIIHLISSTIRKIEGSRDFIVHVSKEDYPYVGMQKKQIQASVVAPNAFLEIIEDLTLAKNECMIETGGGIFDCGLGTELRELTAKLKLLSYEKKEHK